MTEKEIISCPHLRRIRRLLKSGFYFVVGSDNENGKTLTMHSKSSRADSSLEIPRTYTRGSFRNVFMGTGILPKTVPDNILYFLCSEDTVHLGNLLLRELLNLPVYEE